MNRCCRALILIALLLPNFVVAAAEKPAADWPQWRGPNRDSTSPGDSWPANVGEDQLTRTWRVELGPSYSGPIVVGERVFTTETKDAAEEVVRALDRATGEERWQVSWKGAMRVPFFAMSNGSWIRATPAYDDGRLYVAGMRDVLVCLNAETGEEIWRVDFVEKLKTPLPAFGFVSSPLVKAGHVYVQAGASLVKLDKLTGEIVWQTLKDDGGMYGSAFSSPIFASPLGEEQLLVQTRTKLAGVNPTSGDVLWSREIPAFRGMNILTPTVAGDTIFTSSYGGKAFLFAVEKKDDAVALADRWENKVQGYMSSPVVVDGHLYLHLKNQRFTCIELATGESKWTTKPYGKYWSMITNGKQILALDETGELHLIAANPKQFELIGTRKVSDESTWAHLALVGDEIFIRELKAMTAFDRRAARFARPVAERGRDIVPTGTFPGTFCPAGVQIGRKRPIPLNTPAIWDDWWAWDVTFQPPNDAIRAIKGHRMSRYVPAERRLR